MGYRDGMVDGKTGHENLGWEILPLEKEETEEYTG